MLKYHLIWFMAYLSLWKKITYPSSLNSKPKVVLSDNIYSIYRAFFVRFSNKFGFLYQLFGRAIFFWFWSEHFKSQYHDSEYICKLFNWRMCCHSTAVLQIKTIFFVFKGQLISKCPFSVIVWTKIPTKKIENTALEFEKS